MISIRDLKNDRTGRIIFPTVEFPTAIRDIATTMTHCNDFKAEYLLSAMLSAASASLGNSVKVRIKSNWVETPSLYMALVGRPGMGKTPPLRAAYAPIMDYDSMMLNRYKQALRQAEANNSEHPRLTQIVINDTTPEALVRAHNDNQHGIAVYSDELLGFLNTANRYSSGNLIEMLLSAWSGDKIKVTRMSSDEPLEVNTPALSIIGGIQTNLVGQLFGKGFKDNGLLDRFIFVLPEDSNIGAWNTDQDEDDTNVARISDAIDRWSDIVQRLIGLRDRSSQGAVIPFSCEAWPAFAVWRNELVTQFNLSPDNEADPRVMKQISVTARVALLLEMLAWASSEKYNPVIPESISLESVLAAINVCAYYEQSYRDLIASTGVAFRPSDLNEDFLNALPQEFSLQEAYEVGKSKGRTERVVRDMMKRLSDKGKIERHAHGRYRKRSPYNPEILPSPAIPIPV